MERNFTGREAYTLHFDAKGYLNMYRAFGSSPENDQRLIFILDNLHKTFLQDGIGGETLIDIGSGASILQFLSACESFQEIIATDYAAQNWEEMQRWLKRDQEAFNWTPIVKYVCELEGNREKWMEKEEKLRSTIKQVLKCDVTLANPLDPLVVQPASCVSSAFCLESACKDLPTYRSAMKNVGSLVKPGGYLIFLVVLEGTFYMAGQHKFSCLYLNQEMVEGAVKEAGFDIVSFEIHNQCLPEGIADGKHQFFLVAQKPMET